MSGSLEARIARLERTLRLQRLAVVLLGLAAITCGSGITSNFGLVRTARLDVIDGDDHARMSLTSAAGGTIAFTDAEGTVTLDAAAVRRLIRPSPSVPATP